MAERTKQDEARIPDGALWGKETARAIGNFPISGRPLPAGVIRSLAMIKAACATANRDIGRLAPEEADRIRRAALDVAGGAHLDQFPVDVYQTGSGTSTNMNVNEVIAHLASTSSRPIHPNDHVNLGQSSNDVFPTAVHMAAREALEEIALPGLEGLIVALSEKSRDWHDVIGLGRTHSMDAMPRRIGQLIGGYAAMLRDDAVRLRSADHALCAVALGGTAVGTGYGAPPTFVRRALAELAIISGRTFREASNHFAAQGGIDVLVSASATVRGTAISMAKIAADLRWLASGPVGGPAEIQFPPLQAGSSMMPGKVNPVMVETVLQVWARIVGNDASIAAAGASGILDLNTFLPLVADALLESLTLLGRSAAAFADKAVRGLEVDRVRCADLVERSGMLVTALSARIGYDRAAEIAREAQRTGRTVRMVAKEMGVLPAEEIDRLLDPGSMT